MTFEKHSLQKKEIRTNKIKQLGEESVQREAVFNNHRSMREEPEPLIQKVSSLRVEKYHSREQLFLHAG